MAGKAGRKALIKVSGTATAFTDEACTNTVANLEYQITDSAKRVWDRTATITVSVGGTPVAATTYTLNRLTGTVIFGSASVRVVTVTGSYLPLSTAAECKEYSYALAAELLDDSVFGDTWRTFVQGLKKISGSLGRWYIDAYFTDALTAGEPVAVEFYSDSSGSFDVRCWALLNQAQIQSPIAGLIDESVSFEGVTDSDLRAISG